MKKTILFALLAVVLVGCTDETQQIERSIVGLWEHHYFTQGVYRPSGSVFRLNSNGSADVFHRSEMILIAHSGSWSVSDGAIFINMNISMMNGKNIIITHESYMSGYAPTGNVMNLNTMNRVLYAAQWMTDFRVGDVFFVDMVLIRVEE